MRVSKQLKKNVREEGTVQLDLDRKADLVQKVREASLKVVVHEDQETPHGLCLP